MKGSGDLAFSRLALLAIVLSMASAGFIAAQVARDSERPSQSVESPESAGLVQDRSASPLPDSAEESRQAFDYVIGPDDVLVVDVFNVPELARTIRVANDGTISLPLLGIVGAAGLTAQKLQDVLAARYGETYLQDPEVNVYVKEFNAQPVSVLGAVEKPGLYQLTRPRSLIEVLSMAGGLAKRTTDYPGRSIYLTRSAGFAGLVPCEGMQLVAPDKLDVNIRRLLYSQDDCLNIEVKPLDIIAVSKADIVYVVGSVKRAGGFVLEDREQLTVLQAVAMAEGLEGTAAKGSARIIRKAPDGSRTEIPVDLGKILAGKSGDITLAAGDILFIPNSTGKAAAKRGVDAVIATVTGLLIWRR